MDQDAQQRVPTKTLTKGRASPPPYVSAKRTQIIFAKFSMYRFQIQNLVPFAAMLANGFVLENEPILEGVFCGFWMPQKRKMNPNLGDWRYSYELEIAAKHRRGFAANDSGVSSDSAYCRWQVRGRETGAQQGRWVLENMQNYETNSFCPPSRRGREPPSPEPSPPRGEGRKSVTARLQRLSL